MLWILLLPALCSARTFHIRDDSNGTGLTEGVLADGTKVPVAAPSCTDLSTGRSNACWEQLNLTGYVEQWLQTNRCYSGEGFSSCFLRQNGYPELDCSGISESSCVAPEHSGENTDPKAYYVAYNIYSINQFFLSWYTAVGSSAEIAENNVGSLVELIAPPSNFNVSLQSVINALTAGLPTANNSAASVLSNALESTNLSSILFPSAAATKAQQVQIAALEANFAKLIQEVQSNINQTLVAVEANATLFLAFASQGNFSASTPSLPDESNYLYFVFNTYLASECLNGNNIYGTLGLDTNVQQLATNGSTLAYPVCSSYNDQNVCDSWWYSENYGSTFGLDDFSDQGRNFSEVLDILLLNYTSGALLFEGAYACGSASSNKAVNITINANGVNGACISQLKIATWNMGCTDVNKPDCEFLNNPTQPGFLSLNKTIKAHQVPNSYLGPLIDQTAVKIQRT